MIIKSGVCSGWSSHLAGRPCAGGAKCSRCSSSSLISWKLRLNAARKELAPLCAAEEKKIHCFSLSGLKTLLPKANPSCYVKICHLWVQLEEEGDKGKRQTSAISRLL